MLASESVYYNVQDTQAVNNTEITIQSNTNLIKKECNDCIYEFMKNLSRILIPVAVFICLLFLIYIIIINIGQNK
jgi:hypothetical protein